MWPGGERFQIGDLGGGYWFSDSGAKDPIPAPEEEYQSMSNFN